MRPGTTVLLAAIAIALTAGSVSAWPGCEQDILAAAVSGDTLTVSHDKATYNCCLERVDYSVLQSAGRIEITETEFVPNPCLCLCCYDLAVQVVDLAPGTYSLEVRWYDYDVPGWVEWTGEVTVAGSGVLPRVAAVTNSGCIDPTAVPEDGARRPWGRVKALYR